MAKDGFTFGWNWFRFFVIGLLVKRSVGTPADCEEIDLNSIPKPTVSVTFGESLSFTILATQKNWDISAVISDVKGVNCSFGLGIQEGTRFERLECPGEKHNETVPNSASTVPKTHVTLEANRRRTCFYHGNSFTHCSRRFRITLPQLLSKETYKPKWFPTSLQAPMMMTMESLSNAKLTINCKDIECLQTAGKLEGNNSYKRNAFFLKPANSFEGLRIYVGNKIDQSLSINKATLQVSGGLWFNITLETAASDMKVFVDGRDVDVYKLEKKMTEIVIKSVEMDGKGLLTWCDPRERKEEEVPSTGIDLKLVVIAVLLGIIIIMAIAMILLAQKHRLYKQKEMLCPASSQSANATSAIQRDWQEHDAYVNIGMGPRLSYCSNGITRHDSENSLYGEIR